ncbi:unnamed protein product [Spirodela intermedia]|uniref:Disease resistance R13L4/SHOC-2-like LRR domain-containing protein n=1 Tax=Spirodela intermedia TaxID=51605 RepID=A0A7I8LHH3_SPIIN|nr:unnamed protein product [Spirodela intermedia]
MGRFFRSTDEVVEEVKKIHRSLPPRPGIDEVDAAVALVRDADKEEQSRLEDIQKQKKGFDIPDELFSALLEMQKNLETFRCKDQKNDALKLLELENAHVLFDELVQRASRCVASSSHGPNSSLSMSSSSAAAAPTPKPVLNSLTTEIGNTRTELFTRDDGYVKKAKSNFLADRIGLHPFALQSSSPNATTKPMASAGEGSGKLSLIKLATLIEMSSKKGLKDLDLQNKLMDQLDWLPDSIGKLSALLTLNLSENSITALPRTIGTLYSLKRLALRSNRIAELPEEITDLLSLTCLDLQGNRLKSLPSNLSKLVLLQELDLSANQLSVLPDAIGDLLNLRKLVVETNNLEELPHSIGNCTSLIELRADYNRLKALPEAVGRLKTLEILSIRYNTIKSLPTTMSSLSNLKEIDVSFNELESVPESLCLASTLVKMNIGNNFADMRSLPQSIGDLVMLEELNISNNQITVLPDSFAMLSRLRVLHAEENPLEMPPRHLAKMGAQAVVQHMAEHVAKREISVRNARTRKSWTQFCFFSSSNKGKHNSLAYARA